MRPNAPQDPPEEYSCMNPECGGHSIVKVLLLSVVGLQLPRRPTREYLLTMPKRRKFALRRESNSSSNSRMAAVTGSSSGTISLLFGWSRNQDRSLPRRRRQGGQVAPQAARRECDTKGGQRSL